MEPIQLFELASRQAQWLSVRQNVVAGNIANANTPHYKARDVQPFESVLQNTGVQMARPIAPILPRVRMPRRSQRSALSTMSPYSNPATRSRSKKN